MTSESKKSREQREMDRLRRLIALKERYPEVCSVGLGYVTLYFPDGGRRCLVFNDTDQSSKAFGALQDWLAAYVDDVEKSMGGRKR